MAATSSKKVTKNTKTNSSSKKTGSGNSRAKSSTRNTSNRKKQAENRTVARTSKGSRNTRNNGIINADDGLRQEVVFGFVLIGMVVVFLCNIGVIKEELGLAIKSFMLGTFGVLGFFMPFIVLFATIYFILSKDNKRDYIKITAAFALLFFFGAFLSLVSKNNIMDLLDDDHYISTLYEAKSGGGVIFGLLAVLIVNLLGKIGGCIITLFIIVFCIVILSGKSLIQYFDRFINRDLDDEDYEDDDYDEDDDGQMYLTERKNAGLIEDKNSKSKKGGRKRLSEFDMNAFSSKNTGIDNIDDLAIEEDNLTSSEAMLPAVIDEPEETAIVSEAPVKNKNSMEAVKKEAEEIKDFIQKKKNNVNEIRKQKEIQRKELLDRKDDQRILTASKDIVNNDVMPVSVAKDDVHTINIVPELQEDNTIVRKTYGVDPAIYKANSQVTKEVHKDIQEVTLEAKDAHDLVNETIENQVDDKEIVRTIDKVKEQDDSQKSFKEPTISRMYVDDDLINDSSRNSVPDNDENNDLPESDAITKEAINSVMQAQAQQDIANHNINDFEASEDIEDTRFDTSPIHISDDQIAKSVPKDGHEVTVNVPKPNDTPMKNDIGYVSIKPYDTLTDLTNMPEPITERTHEAAAKDVPAPAEKKIRKIVHKRSDYKKPTMDLLTLNDKKGLGDSDKALKETALKLQETLETFGVKAEVSHISQGPSVTRYELTLGAGIKVNKIVNLTDDIKLSLAAIDIRIEAPIPGKSAIGIEIPNKETSPVLIRDLIDSSEFKNADSRLSFGVGKDITGKTIVADIAKMPHMLIAGSTGSGKSVCINTLIMSVLYNAHPDDVKLIMIDPKVVELSVYNGIPHLMIPVVTDPKKASAALKWAVNEMTNRYNAFASFNVRDLKGFNEKAAQMQKENPDDAPDVLPQIIVIVDELADLMMVASKEVEESICRLAQLARAAGIHLIIATQRPSVDVITGLIKANMPSRVAFRVSSGVDSRTILDMVGAERLLGKGDMLFYPQGYAKPLRVQGAFVSDKEVSDVVEFLIKNNQGYNVENDIESEINGLQNGGDNQSSSAESNGQDNSGVDEYFKEACRSVVKKGSASSGYLQRMYRIGFNRAARIVDQMEEYGIVGPENGTKPRQVLVSETQLEALLSSIK